MRSRVERCPPRRRASSAGTAARPFPLMRNSVPGAAPRFWSFGPRQRAGRTFPEPEQSTSLTRWALVDRTPDLSDVNDTDGSPLVHTGGICSTNVHAHRRWSMELGGQIGRQHEVVTAASSSRFAQRPEDGGEKSASCRGRARLRAPARANHT